MGLSAVKDDAAKTGERNDNDEEKNDLDDFGKGKRKEMNDGKCNVCGGDGHNARECPSVAGPNMGTQECYGCSGKGHNKSACPTANPHLKGQGKGQGQGWQGKGQGQGWQQKGGKGYGGGESKGKGKGKGSGKGKGLYELDIINQGG